MRILRFVRILSVKLLPEIIRSLVYFGTKGSEIYLMNKSEILKTNEWKSSRYVVQEHNAERAGLHYDFRFEHNNTLLSWAGRKMPAANEIRGFFRQSDHDISYFDFEGIIPNGYGKGTVKIVERGTCLYKIENDHISMILYPDNGNRYEMTLIQLKGKGDPWLFSNHTISRPEFWKERANYKLAPIDKDVWNKNYYVTEKYDGANYFMVINDKGKVSFISRRISVDGNTIHKEDQLIHISSQKIPKKYWGHVIQGEIYHDRGASFASGILNSKPPRAINTQNEFGHLKFVPFDCDIESTPIEKRIWLEELCELEYIHQPLILKSKHDLDNVLNRGGEGAVAIDLNTGEIWKIKKEDYFDLIVVEITRGKGRNKNRLGALIGKDPSTGSLTNVGTGFSDSQREEIYLHKERYIGQKFRTTGMEKTDKGSIRAPRFKDWHPESDIPVYEYAEGANPEDVEGTKYAIITKAGWKK